MAYAFISAIPTPDPYLAGVPRSLRLTTQITFEPEQVPVDGKQCYYNTSDGHASTHRPGKGHPP